MKLKKTISAEEKILDKFCKENNIDLRTLRMLIDTILLERKIREIQTAAIPITCTSKKALARYIEQIKPFSSKRISNLRTIK